MSLGYVGCCKKELEDGRTVVYAYHAENWNLPAEQRARLEVIEGMFTIDRASLEEPEIHQGRDGTEKRVLHTPNIARHIEEGGIVVDKLSGVDQWERNQGKKYPRCLMNILRGIYESYMKNGELPEEDAFIQ